MKSLLITPSPLPSTPVSPVFATKLNNAWRKKFKFITFKEINLHVKHSIYYLFWLLHCFFFSLFQVTLERFDNGPTKDVFYFRIDECGCILCSEVSVSGSPNWHASQLTAITWWFNVPCDKSCDKTVSNKMFEFFIFISPLIMFFLIRRQ